MELRSRLEFQDAVGAFVEVGLGGIAGPVEGVVALAAVVVVLERDREADVRRGRLVPYGAPGDVEAFGVAVAGKDKRLAGPPVRIGAVGAEGAIGEDVPLGRGRRARRLRRHRPPLRPRLSQGSAAWFLSGVEAQEVAVALAGGGSLAAVPPHVDQVLLAQAEKDCRLIPQNWGINYPLNFKTIENTGVSSIPCGSGNPTDFFS